VRTPAAEGAAAQEEPADAEASELATSGATPF